MKENANDEGVKQFCFCMLLAQLRPQRVLTVGKLLFLFQDQSNNNTLCG